MDACVVGTGLVGASIAIALTTAGHQVYLRDQVPAHAQVAASLGGGSTAQPDPDRVQLCVVAVPPAAIAAVVAEALSRYPQAVVTDVGSVKGSVLRQLQQSGTDLHRYLGSHPMAGSQHAGPLTARGDLFQDRAWVLCPHPQTSPDAVAQVERLALTCGARCVTLDPDAHDVAVAQVSHLPQLMSTLTAARLLHVPAQHLRLAGQGIRDVTRIAGSDPDLWRQIVTANAAALRPELAAVHQQLGELLRVLDDPDQVRRVLAQGQEGTRALPGKHGQAPAAYAQVVVEIPDTPGALARLFSQIGAAGVNVEDLTIEHDEAREVGFLAVSVAPHQAAQLEQAMREAGWVLRP